MSMRKSIAACSGHTPTSRITDITVVWTQT
jgi:hypothetical protein